jgi:dihydroorotate dehydrogenase (fumarate)
MAGANVAMTTSALLEYGVEHASQLMDNVQRWMEEHEYESITQMRGSMSQRSVAEPTAFEHANYMKALNTFSL